jgi:hypothetical protein
MGHPDWYQGLGGGHTTGDGEQRLGTLVQQPNLSVAATAAAAAVPSKCSTAKTLADAAVAGTAFSTAITISSRRSKLSAGIEAVSLCAIACRGN